MRIHLVNLDRRPDRLEAMARQFARLGLPFQRFSALDASRLDAAALEAPFAPGGPMGTLATGDRGCALSHLALWRQIAAGDEPFAAVLEDDVLLADTAADFLQSDVWIPRYVNLVKLERYGDANQLVVLGSPRLRTIDREIAPLLSRHTGTGGYIIARDAAARLSAMTEKLDLPIDHLMFNPNNSRAFAWLKPWQLYPAVLEQTEEVGGGTDIHRTRLTDRPRGLAGLRRRLKRNYYDMRLLPQQAAAVLSGKARVVKMRVV